MRYHYNHFSEFDAETDLLAFELSFVSSTPGTDGTWLSSKEFLSKIKETKPNKNINSKVLFISHI